MFSKKLVCGRECLICTEQVCPLAKRDKEMRQKVEKALGVPNQRRKEKYEDVRFH